MIKKLRTETGMTQKEFSEFLGIPHRTIQNWEGGQRECPAYLVELIKYKLNGEKKMKKYYTDTVTSMYYDIPLGRIGLSLKHADYIHFVSTDNIKFGGKNCEIKFLEVGSKIKYICDNKLRIIDSLTVMSAHGMEVDDEGTLIQGKY